MGLASPYWPVVTAFETRGPGHERSLIFTYAFYGTAAAVGEEMSRKDDAKESAAEEAWVIWDVSISPQTMSTKLTS